MKNHILLFSLFTTLFVSCIKPAKTSLKLTLINEVGNPVSGANVKLYASQTDYNNRTNQVGSTQFSNSDGQVTFEDLASIKYFWFAEKDCRNNSKGAATTTSPITEGKINAVDNVILSPYGSLRLTSTSTNPYKIYINGNYVFDLNGGASQTVNNLPTGSISVRVLQISGYIISPTDKTYNGTIGCGQTFDVTFP